MTIDDVIAGVPAWSGRDVTYVAIGGGLTNANYRIEVGGERFCVRIPGRDSSMLAIDRQREWKNTVAAAGSGVGAAVVHTVGDLPVMILEWLDGVPFTNELFAERGDECIPAMAAAIRQLHEGPAFEGDFDMFRIQERYRSICREHDFRIPERLRRVRAAVARDRDGHVPPATPDGALQQRSASGELHRAGRRFRLIDYEYSGNNDACFELGNACSECSRTPIGWRSLWPLLRAARPIGARARRLWAAMADYGWTLWAAIQDGVSDIDFDFWGWGMEKYAAATSAFVDDDFSRLLEAASRG